MDHFKKIEMYIIEIKDEIGDIRDAFLEHERKEEGLLDRIITQQGMLVEKFNKHSEMWNKQLKINDKVEFRYKVIYVILMLLFIGIIMYNLWTFTF